MAARFLLFAALLCTVLLSTAVPSTQESTMSMDSHLHMDPISADPPHFTMDPTSMSPYVAMRIFISLLDKVLLMISYQLLL